MRCRWLVAVGFAAGCGRLGFDATERLDDAGTTSGDVADASPDAAPGSLVAYIKASNTETFDQFGSAIALSRDGFTLAVGAPGEDSDAAAVDGPQGNNNASQSGAVYVFNRIGTTWQQQAYIKPTSPSSGDLFGWSVALSDDGSVLVVGAPLEDSATVGVDSTPGDVTPDYDAGAAYIFVRTGSTWAQTTYLKASNTDSLDDFGVAVAISGDGRCVAVGAGYEDSAATVIDGNQASNTAADAGAVYLYVNGGGAWTQQAYIKPTNTDAGDRFGVSVALTADGATLVVGAEAEDSAATSIDGDQNDDTATEAGAVYVYARSGTTWSQQAYIKPPAIDFGDFFGKRLALSAGGDVLACSAPGEDSTIANSGAAYLFTRFGTTWSQGPMLKAPNAGDSDQFGVDIALGGAGTLALVGAPLEDSAAAGTNGNQTDDSSESSGAAYRYIDSASTWSVTHYMKSPIPSPGDQFGYAVALDGSGETAAFAAPREDSGAKGVGGDATDETRMDSGAVYILYR